MGPLAQTVCIFTFKMHSLDMSLMALGAGILRVVTYLNMYHPPWETLAGPQRIVN